MTLKYKGTFLFMISHKYILGYKVRVIKVVLVRAWLYLMMLELLD